MIITEILTKEYNGKNAVDNLNLKVGERENKGVLEMNKILKDITEAKTL